MSSPFDQVTFNQSPAYMPVRFKFGDDLSISVTFPFAITSYTFIGNVFDASKNLVGTFACTVPSQYVLLVTASKDLTTTFKAGYNYEISWEDTSKRTILYGIFEDVTLD